MKRHTPVVSASFPVVLVCLLFAGSLLGKPLSSDTNSGQRFSSSSIQIQPMDSGDVVMPSEFRVSVYENLITQIQKTGKFQHVYRSGDKDAVAAPDLVTLHLTAQSFKEGSQKKREVVTVAGWSSITLKVHITDHAGQTLVDRDVQGKVRFFGENLNVTYDFSKKVAGIVRDTF
jgi:hypothetical protein